MSSSLPPGTVEVGLCFDLAQDSVLPLLVDFISSHFSVINITHALTLSAKMVAEDDAEKKSFYLDSNRRTSSNRGVGASVQPLGRSGCFRHTPYGATNICGAYFTIYHHRNMLMLIGLHGTIVEAVDWCCISHPVNLSLTPIIVSAMESSEGTNSRPSCVRGCSILSYDEGDAE